MSWFETVRFIVTQTAANSISAVIGIPIGKQDSLANPFGRRSDRVHLDEKETGSANEAESEDSEEEEDNSEEAEASSVAVRITTRARITYELDRFKKNAMLVFVQIRSNNGCRIEETTMKEVEVLLDTFTDFRFEVTVHIDLTCMEIETKCEEFFQQDFSQYGAVLVAVLSFDGITGQLAAMDGRFSETNILRHLTYDLNPTLIGKPKVYITETNRTYHRYSARNSVSIPLGASADVLALHYPAVDNGLLSGRRHALMIMCDYIKKMADTNDFVSILTKSVSDTIQSFPVFQMIPIELNSTFTKEMWLARS